MRAKPWLVMPLCCSIGGLAAAAAPTVWDFDGDAPDRAPAAFSLGRTGQGRAGKWVVKTDKDARSGDRVLAQLDADDTDYRFPVAVADAPVARDLKLSVKCKPVSGKVEGLWTKADSVTYFDDLTVTPE